MDRAANQSVTTDEAVLGLCSGMNVFVHGAAATPTALLEAICRRQNLTDVTIYSMHREGPAPILNAECPARFRSVSLFTGSPVRQAVQNGLADFIPVFLSDIPGLFHSGLIRLDAALVHFSSADRHGFCSLGTLVDAARAAVDSATLVISEVNRQMPRTHGQRTPNKTQLTRFVCWSCGGFGILNDQGGIESWQSL